MLPTTILKTIENLPQAGFFAYITYQLHKILAHWELILCVLGLLAIVVFFLIPLAKNSSRLTPEWRIIALLTLAGSLGLATKIWQIAQKELFLEKITTQYPINAKAKKVQTLIMQGKVEELQTLLEAGELDLGMRASQQDWPTLHLLTIASCQHRAFVPLLKKVLNQKEIPLDLAGINCFSPLHLAAYMGNKKVCKLLIKAGIISCITKSSDLKPLLKLCGFLK